MFIWEESLWRRSANAWNECKTIRNKSKVALALYPNTFTPNIATSNTFVAKTNYEIYNDSLLNHIIMWL